MTEVRIAEDCAAPAEAAFAFMNDYRNLPKFWYGIESFTPSPRRPTASARRSTGR